MEQMPCFREPLSSETQQEPLVSGARPRFMCRRTATLWTANGPSGASGVSGSPGQRGLPGRGFQLVPFGHGSKPRTPSEHPNPH